VAEVARPFRVRMPRKTGTRPCLLYRVYNNMRSRAHGTGTKAPWVYKPGWPWKSYSDFRAWALSLNPAGTSFTKTTPSPDRCDVHKPYGPDNVKWVPVLDNNRTARGRRYHFMERPPSCNDCGDVICSCPVPF